MLKHFSYSVKFPSTGKEFGATVDFENGLTVVTGSNEAGKSLILEMIRYTLFGKAALRGAAGDYKSLKTRLVFQTGGKEYQVTKTNTKEIISYLGGEEIAVGSSILNAKIPEILGFGLKVFDTACSCNQGEIEALGNMKPTERKRMVDSVIGLTVLEDLETWTRGEANAENRTAEALRLNLPEKPVEPTRPKFYEPPETTSKRLKQVRLQLNRKAEINGFLSSEPKKPAPALKRPNIEGTIEELKEKAQRCIELESMLANTKRKHDAIPDAAYTAKQLDAITVQTMAYNLYQKNQQEIRARGPKPAMTSAELGRIEASLNAYHDWEIKRDLLAKGEHECPACHHKWPVADLGRYADVQEVERPTTTPNEIRAERQRIESWAAPLEALSPVEVPALTHAEIEFHHKALERAATKDALKVALRDLNDELETLQHAKSEYDIISEWHSQIKAYEIENKAYLEWVTRADELKAELAGLTVTQHDYDTINKLLLENQSFDRDNKAYFDKLQTFNTALLTLNHHTETQKGYAAAAQALKDLRTRVKQFLIPSLNRVASILLSQMTGGARAKVEIDEEFNIQIDDQPLSTLSGSGKAVANLAVRIGLGQVLTNKVFPVFMADEIDAAMDQERSNYTTDCLRGLSSVISQVILVTHKRPDADFYVDV
jgi:DNA repair exonuclease SbcCD ATPase subunit